MAGATMEGDENPVAVNVVALIDVIFCLCVFFMCSFKFRQLEGKFDTWLPKNKGTQSLATDLIEIRVMMTWVPDTKKTLRQLGMRKIGEDAELQQLIKEANDDFQRQGKLDVPVTIDAAAAVPWSEVIKVVNMCQREKIAKIEFALGVPLGPK